MKKNFPWLVSLFFFLVSVAILLAPGKRPYKAPLLTDEVWEEEVEMLFPNSDFQIIGRSGGGGRDRFERGKTFSLQGSAPIPTDLEPFEKRLAQLERFSSISRSGGNDPDITLSNDDRVIRITIRHLDGNQVLIESFEVLR